MRSDRLLATLLLLQSRGPMSAPELARRLEVSVRTVYRDVDALSAAGVPVWAERGRAGGIRLLDGWRTDMTGLTAAEAQALFSFGARAGASLPDGAGDLGSAFRKLLAALPEPQRDVVATVEERILIEPEGWRRAPDRSPWLAVLQRAVLDGQRVSLAYRAAGRDRARTRTVDPVGLVAKAGTWYLVAVQEGEPRMFRVSRVVQADPVGELVAVPRPDLAELWDGLRERLAEGVAEVVAVVRAPTFVIGLLLTSCGPTLAGPVERRGAAPSPEGGAPVEELALPFRSWREATSLLLGLSLVAEVVGPPELRRALADQAEATAARYAEP